MGKIVTKLEKTVVAEIPQTELQAIDREFGLAIEENLTRLNITPNSEKGKQVLAFLKDRKEMLTLDTAKKLLIEKMKEETLALQGYVKILSDNHIMGDLYVLEADPSKYVSVKENNYAEFSIMGVYYHTVKEFAETQSLSLAKDEDNILKTLGYKTLNTVQKGKEGSFQFTQYMGATITRAAENNSVPALLHVAAAIVVNDENIPSTFTSYEITIAAAQAIMKQFKKHEDRIKKEELEKGNKHEN